MFHRSGGDSAARQQSLASQLANIDRKIDGLTERLLATNVDTVIGAYEAQIGKLEQKNGP